MNPEPEAASRKGRLRRIAGRALGEPLTHFLAIGAIIFLAASLVRGAQRPVVRIDPDEQKQLAAYWEMQTQRPPSQDELREMIRERIDEEVLAREAVRLGLDRDDMIIRRRLAQKMAFASEDTIADVEPDDATLQAFYDRTRQAYLAPARVALRHLYFSDDRPAADAKDAATRALAALNAGRPAITGDPFVLPLAYADIGLDELARDYGAAFAQGLATAPTGAWQGPLRSEFGWHVVRVETRHPAAVAPFASVRDEVRQAYLADRRRIGNASMMDSMRNRYRIVIDEAPKLPAHES